MIPEEVDLSDWEGYTASKEGYRHHDKAVVGWLDGHVKSHGKSIVALRSDAEDGVILVGNDRLVYWNLH